MSSELSEKNKRSDQEKERLEAMLIDVNSSFAEIKRQRDADVNFVSSQRDRLESERQNFIRERDEHISYLQSERNIFTKEKDEWITEKKNFIQLNYTEKRTFELENLRVSTKYQQLTELEEEIKIKKAQEDAHNEMLRNSLTVELQKLKSKRNDLDKNIASFRYEIMEFEAKKAKFVAEETIFSNQVVEIQKAVQESKKLHQDSVSERLIAARFKYDGQNAFDNIEMIKNEVYIYNIGGTTAKDT